METKYKETYTNSKMTTAHNTGWLPKFATICLQFLSKKDRNLLKYTDNTDNRDIGNASFG